MGMHQTATTTFSHFVNEYWTLTYMTENIQYRSVSPSFQKYPLSYTAAIKVFTWSISVNSSKCLKYWLAGLLLSVPVCSVSSESRYLSHRSRSQHNPCICLQPFETWKYGGCTSHHNTTSLRSNVPVFITTEVLFPQKESRKLGKGIQL